VGGHSKIREAEGIPEGCWIQKNLTKVLQVPRPRQCAGFIMGSSQKLSGKFPCEPMGPVERDAHHYKCCKCVARRSVENSNDRDRGQYMAKMHDHDRENINVEC